MSRIPDAHLVVAGDGPLRQEIEATAEELLPGRFTRLSVSPAMMPGLYRSADVFLHLSKDEPSSLAFLEALACGLPLVAHDLPQLRYIIGNEEFLVDTDDIALVASQIALAREHLPDKVAETIDNGSGVLLEKHCCTISKFFSGNREFIITALTLPFLAPEQ